jgi:DNA processing protein
MKYEIIEYKDFPEKLKVIKNPPRKVYVAGNKNLLYEPSFAVVGTRKITEYGISNCKHFTKELALRDIPIVSGMAIGTDTVAHKTALETRGKTIAVLGSGFNNIFPEENINLFNEIIENNGLILTEFEQDVKPNKENFPKRNRIITALSEGVLVIEAAYRSGASITANNAIKQGKKVFALPGKLDSYVGVGVNNMIKKGAILTTNITDILENYPQFENRKRKKETLNFIKKPKIKEEYLEIFNAIKNGYKTIEEISEKIDMDMRVLLKILSNMEIEGIITKNFMGEIEISKRGNIKIKKDDNLYKKKLGNFGEKIVAKYLESLDYEIIAKNFKTKFGEIDIVALDKNEFTFIEVKTRTSNKYGRPVEAVNKVKEKHIILASKYFIYKNRLENQFIRYDIIEVYALKNQKVIINHIKNAFL